jgi:uncharacterized protein YkwD
VSAFGEDHPDPYDPYAAPPQYNELSSSRYYGGYEGAPEQGDPQHRRGSRALLVAGIGMVALVVVGAVAFGGSLLLSSNSDAAAPKVAAGAASSTEAGGLFGDVAAGSSASGPAEETTTSAAPTKAPTTAAAPKTTAPTTKKTTGAPGGTGNSAYEAQVLSIVNTERAKAGCQPLAFNARLRTAAFKHSADMAARDYFSHDTPDGVSFATRITNEGYRWSNAAENIAKGQRTPEDVMTAWMNSPGHRANILNCATKSIGAGVTYAADGTPYYAEVFGWQ